MNARACSLFIAIRWEMLRLPFNLVMLGAGVWVPRGLRVQVDEHLGLDYWVLFFLCMGVANAVYSLGPFSEAYLFAFWNRRPHV